MRQGYQGSRVEHVCLYKNATCLISSFTKVRWVKHDRHCASWMPQGSHPGIGMLHAGYTPDNEKRQNGVWGGGGWDNPPYAQITQPPWLPGPSFC